MGLRVAFTPVSRTALFQLRQQMEDNGSALFAAWAREQIAAAAAQNTTALGHPVPYTTTVNGVPSADFEGSKPGTEVVATFDISAMKGQVLAWIFATLLDFAPIGSGRDKHPGLYRRSIMVLLDGVEQEDLDHVASAGGEILFTDTQPYARKIERRKAAGVFQAVAAMAAARYGNTTAVKYTMASLALSGVGEDFRSWATTHAGRSHHVRRQLARDLRQPAISVRFR